MSFYPILVNLEGQKAVVVGGGRVAERKIETLLAHGAAVHVIAKELTPALTGYAQDGEIRHLGREFEERDLDDAFVVVAATNDPSLNRRVSEIARKKGLLVNAVDQPSDCNFIVPSILKRGDLLISVSTSGKSPALARKIREGLEGMFGKEYESFLVLMGRVRGEILSRGGASDENKRLFQDLVHSDILNGIRENDMEKVAALLSKILESRSRLVMSEPISRRSEIMSSLLFIPSLLLILLAASGFVVYIVKQKKPVYEWSYRVLVAGFVIHTLSIAHQYYVLGVAPVITLKAALSFFSWTIIGAYLIFHLKFRLMVLGSFIVPLGACMMIVSSTIPAAEITVKPILRSLWLTVHVGTAFVGNGILALTFIASIMYLIQENQIKKKKFGSLYSRLPSLESLDSINRLSLMYGFAFLTVGMVTGAVYAQYALGSYWRWDPKEVWSLIAWIIYAVLLHERLAVGWRGRRAAVMAIFAFAVLIFTFLGASLWLSDYHSFKSLEGRFGL